MHKGQVTIGREDGGGGGGERARGWFSIMDTFDHEATCQTTPDSTQNTCQTVHVFPRLCPDQDMSENVGPSPHCDLRFGEEQEADSANLCRILGVIKS